MKQCEKCFRYFGEQGELLCPQPRFLGVPVFFMCGQADCREPVRETVIVKEKLKVSAIDDGKREVGKTGRREGAKKFGRRGSSAMPSFGADRSCPRDTEPLEEQTSNIQQSFRTGTTSNFEIGKVTPKHAEQVAEFGRSENAQDQNELMLRTLMASFDGTRPGAWVSNGALQELGIGRANSRASQIRELAAVRERGLDVDSAIIPNTSGNGKQWWGYRICLRRDSMRLKREEERGEQERLNFERESS